MGAMDVIDDLGEFAVVESARIVFHELFEPILVQLFVLHMEIFVFLHVSLVFESELASWSVAVEMGGVLTLERAIGCFAVILPPESEEPFPLDCIVFSVVIKVHLDVAGGYVDLVTGFSVNAMIMSLFFVVLTPRELLRAVVHWGHPPESILECLIHFLVPF